MTQSVPLLPFVRRRRNTRNERISGMTPEHLQTLRQAHRRLEQPSFAARLANVVGTPVEMLFRLFPRSWNVHLHHAAENAIEHALDAAIRSLEGRDPDISPARFSRTRYKVMGGLTGAVGGFFGGAAMWLELPATTLLMLRAIAQIASEEGEDIRSLETRLACLEVFALGGHSREDDATDTGYYSLRLAMQIPVASAARHIAVYGMEVRGAPILVGLMSRVSQRFGVVLSQKLAAEIIPVVGALGGAAVNTLFMQHFIDVARGHFVVRRLEKIYGPDVVRAAYTGFCEEKSSASRNGSLTREAA